MYAVRETMQSSLERQVILMNVCFIVDNSASMRGTKWIGAKAGLRQCIADLHDADVVTLIFFGDKLQGSRTMQKRDLDMGSLFGSVEPDGTGTRLFDAIVHGVGKAVETHNRVSQLAAANGMGCHTHVVVLTDGVNNGSDLLQEDVEKAFKAVVGHRGFKITIAGVELNDAAAEVMGDLITVGDEEDIEYRNLNRASDIKGLFQHVGVGIRQRPRVEVTRINPLEAALLGGLGGGGGGVHIRRSAPQPQFQHVHIGTRQQRNEECTVS